MANENLGILFEVDGGESVDKGSGKLIAKQLKNIAKNIGKDDKKRPNVVVDLNIDKSSKLIEKQLKSIVKQLKVENLNLDVNSDGFSKSVEKDLNKAKDKIRSFKNTAEIKSLGKLYVGDRSKTNPIDNIVGQLKSQTDVASISVTGKNYFDKNKEQLKSFSTTVTLTTGEVKKLNFELSNIGKRKGFVQTDNSSFKFKDDIEKTTKALEKQKQEIEALVRLASSDKLNESFDKTKIDLKRFGLFDDKDISNQITEVNKIFEDIKTKQIGYNGSDKEKAEIAGLVTEYQTLDKEINDVIKTKKRLTNEDSAFIKQQNRLQGYINDTQSYLQNNGRLKGTESEQELKNIINEAKRLQSTFKETGKFVETDVDNINKKLLRSKGNIKSLGLEGQSFAQRLGSQLEKLGIYITGAFVVMGAVRQFKQMITTVKELDQVITDLSVATGYNRQKTKELLDTYSGLGKELGATTVDVGKAADSWLRQGYSIENTNKLIKDSMMLSKLGQIDSNEATTALTATMKGYGISVEDATTIVDKFTAVDKEAAVSAGGIATAMQETATGARLAGIDINKLTGYIASVSEVTQDGDESIGVFYKTLFARMGNIKSGKLIDPETQEDLSDVEVTLNNLGVKLRENGGKFKNFGVVLDGVYSKWNKLGNVNQRAIAVAFAGWVRVA